MSDDIVKLTGTLKNYKDDRGGATLYSSPIIGIVKNNIDPLKSGKIQVYLNRLNGPNPDKPVNWTTVSYLSPFFGYTPNTGSPDSAGDYIGNPNSYGFWATPPDIGTEVVCIFVNGDPNFGYYIGGIPKEGLTHMVPAIGASSFVIPNEGEAKSYGGADRLPVTEYNSANNKQDNSSVPIDSPRPVHSYQTAILNKQGLLRDPDRGAISSSSQRESPSRVFGMSTPGRPIYEGGYNDQTIMAAIKDDSIPAKKFKVVGRLGGHTLVMDDGDYEGRDQLTRIRTSGGHTIMMNDSAQTLFIIHANGQSYIELGKEGTIDMYSTNSVNIRTQGDLNLHADNNISINAANDLNLSAKNLNLESIESTKQFVGTTFQQLTKGNHTLKVNNKMSFDSKGDSSIKSAGIAYVNGSKVHLNTGASSLVPEEVNQLPIIAHTDTLYDETKGFAPAPGKLSSIVTRAPAHSPWANANQGVDVKVDMGASSNLPSTPSAGLSQVNTSTEGSSVTPTTPSVVATVPNTKAVSKTVGAATASAVISQMALNASTGLTKDAIKTGAGIVDLAGTKVASIGQLGLTPNQLVTAGILKPGTEVAINAAIQAGKTINQSIPTNLFTGKDGINSVKNLVSSVSAQTNAAVDLMKKSETALQTAGLLTGKESGTQAAGLLLSSAVAGTSATIDYAKGVINSAVTSDIAGAASAATADLKAKLSTVSSLPIPNNPLAGPVKNLIAGGNQAAGLADKVMGSLGGVDVGAALKGAVAGVFSKITSSFKALKANVPQSLTIAKAEASAASAKAQDAKAGLTPQQLELLGNADASDPFIRARLGLPPLPGTGISALDAKAGLSPQQLLSLGGADATDPAVRDRLSLPKLSVTSAVNAAQDAAKKIAGGTIPGIPGGAGAISNIVKAGGTTIGGIPGTGQITATAKSIAGALTGGSGTVNGIVNNLKKQIGDKGGLSAFASAGLDKAAAAELTGAISSLGNGGSVLVKAPTIALDTFNFGSLQAQSSSLLGNAKIPPLNFGAISVPTQPLTADQVAAYNATKQKLTEAEEAQWELRKKYLDDKAKYGQNGAETVASYEAYKECLQNIENLRKELSTISSTRST